MRSLTVKALAEHATAVAESGCVNGVIAAIMVSGRSRTGAKLAVSWKAVDIEVRRLAGAWSPTYRFDEGVLADTDVTVTASSIELGEQHIDLRDDVPEAWRFD